MSAKHEYSMTEKVRKHKRGYLPHYDSEALMQFVTFRLADSLPTFIYDDLKFKVQTKQISEIEYHRAIERALDIGNGQNFLKDPRIAKLVAEALIKFDGNRYELLAWVIMPNHVHLLLKTKHGYTLSEIMHSIKSFTAIKANMILGGKGRFWSPDYVDRFIRDRVHLTRVKSYIEENPVKAGLRGSPEDWPWSSIGYKG